MQLGVIGLSTMGANVARNAARNGAAVAVYNRTQERTDAFIKQYKSEGMFVPCKSYAYLVAALKPPRPILIMVKAGDAVAQVIEELMPLLSKGDILIDGGNSHDIDTMVRGKKLKEKGILYLGMGVSGGEEGALKGPSMMPGGDRKAYEVMEPLFRKMAADDGSSVLPTGSESGKCVTYIGPEGSGHFVKMVHNGIEYGIMQLIAEAYHLLRAEGGLTNVELANLFQEWNRSGYLQSFLTEITAKIFRKKDRLTGSDLLDVILDAAEQKGTGQWTTSTAMHYGVAVPTITAAVDARIISSAKEFRTERSKVVPVVLEEAPVDCSMLIADVRSALELSIIHTYTQGFQLMTVVSADQGWNLNLNEIARIWRGGCIIRSALLPQFQKIFAGDQETADAMREYSSGDRQRAWRRVVALGALKGVPIPAFSGSLSYFDACRTERLPQNLIQAQRDFFGAHTYRRTDRGGVFHTHWEENA